MEIQIDTKGLLRKVGFLRRLFQGRRILGIVSEAQLAWIDQNFATGGAISGRRWAENRPNTVAAKGHTLVLQRTGALRRSFRANISALSGGGHLRVGTKNRIARFHEEGTRPHTIVPRSARALRFFTVDGVVFAKSVRHPGTPIRKMLPSRAIADRVSELALSKALGRDLKKI